VLFASFAFFADKYSFYGLSKETELLRMHVQQHENICVYLRSSVDNGFFTKYPHIKKAAQRAAFK